MRGKKFILFIVLFLFILTVSWFKSATINSYKTELNFDTVPKWLEQHDMYVYLVNNVNIYVAEDMSQSYYDITGDRKIDIKGHGFEDSVLLWVGNADFDINIEVYIYDYKEDKNYFYEITEKEEVLKEKDKYSILTMKSLVNVGFMTWSNVGGIFGVVFDSSAEHSFYMNYWND